MLRPTEKELKKAAELGIDLGNMNAVQLRDAIRRAEARKAPQSIAVLDKYKELADNAAMLEVPIRPGDGSRAVSKRIEAKLLELFQEKGIQPGTKIRFTDEYKGYEGRVFCVTSLEFYWVRQKPRLRVLPLEGTKLNNISASAVALYAVVVE